MGRPALSVVIPTFNEAAVIGDTLAEIGQALSDRALNFEIVVSDDGSTDATGDGVEEMRRAGLPVRLLTSPANRGKGAAVRRGMLAARGDVVLFTDADLSTPLDELDRILPRLQAGAPVVIGSRKLEPGRVTRRQPLYRQSLGRVFSWLARRLLHPHVADFTCGFKAFRAEVVPLLFEPLTLEGWAFDAELLHVAYRRGVAVEEIPVRWENRPDSRVRLFPDMFTSALGLVVVVWRGARGRYDPPGPT